MSELLASVKRSFYHEVLSYSDAEQRLEGKNGGYLFRESNVKPGMFILSYVRKSSVAHVLVPNKNRKFICQPLEEAVEIAADVIAASECYIHPVPPPPPSQDTSSRSETADSGGSGQTNKKHSKKAKKKGNKAGPSGAGGEGVSSSCYCCGFTTDDKRKLESHQKTHKVIKCQECSKYINSGTFQGHKRYCNSTPEHLSCGICGYF